MTSTALGYGSEIALSDGFDSATRDNPRFRANFSHHFQTIDGLQMHYVVGGTGPTPILLLHGFTETWFGWLPLLDDLLPGHTVIAVDLPGFGDSTGNLPAHNKRALASYVHKLLDGLGFTEGVQLVSHDAGGGIAFALATTWRDQFAGLLVMDFPIVGGALTYEQVRPLSYHFAFHAQEPIFEQLVEGRERTYLEYFYAAMSPNAPRVIESDVVDEYERAYSRPGALRNGSRYYQAWEQDEIDNRQAMEQPLTIPVLMVAQRELLDPFLAAIRSAAPDATGRALDTGHWMLHEAPDAVLSIIRDFYAFSATP